MTHAAADRDSEIAVLGAGSGGLALAGSLARRGFGVRLWNRDAERLQTLRDAGHIRLRGCLAADVPLPQCTTDLAEAVRGAALILVVTTADAHESIATRLAPLLEAGQCILLCPGRTGGAIVVRATIARLPCARGILVAEAQSLVYACRAEAACVNLIGTKALVPVAAYPAADIELVLRRVSPLFDCFQAAPTVLHTGLENIGAIFHPAIVLFNAAAIERGDGFYLYRDMTPCLAECLLALDRERIAIGAAFGIRLYSIFDWIKRAYPMTEGDTLCTRFRNNPAYSDILAPTALNSRLLTEDLPTGLVPMAALGAAAGIETPLMDALIDLGSAILGRDFRAEGRTLERLGLAGLSPSQITAQLS
ncbi:MAG: NAD/NADP octopine/nopaline dehydrogenase family protein [Thiocapsa sp.]|uniref:NAD/NADP-dependent octopine/nopaline dehydrogenase family protein n=1 Tax=Thiocapsa sp. TaxID=2024551 RepID=UPI001BCDEF0A|nr:NAD/NADP-dependent octopine/nopaline dehydrogenase family protein [Thiocapsa sp.]QVL50130.1 MAG: NAD/NADP octopine/nopaline dehydrogenase family protein [Thiocapsa sp.]